MIILIGVPYQAATQQLNQTVTDMMGHFFSRRVSQFFGTSVPLRSHDGFSNSLMVAPETLPWDGIEDQIDAASCR